MLLLLQHLLEHRQPLLVTLLIVRQCRLQAPLPGVQALVRLGPVVERLQTGDGGEQGEVGQADPVPHGILALRQEPVQVVERLLQHVGLGLVRYRAAVDHWVLSGENGW